MSIAGGQPGLAAARAAHALPLPAVARTSSRALACHADATGRSACPGAALRRRGIAEQGPARAVVHDEWTSRARREESAFCRHRRRPLPESRTRCNRAGVLTEAHLSSTEELGRFSNRKSTVSVPSC